jgi:hypothetical protein
MKWRERTVKKGGKRGGGMPLKNEERELLIAPHSLTCSPLVFA